jgi:hypothetical protein
MIWSTPKKRRDEAGPILGHLAVIGQAGSSALALYVALAAAGQIFIPGLLTDRVSPVALAALAGIGLALGTLAEPARTGLARLHPVLAVVLLATAVWSAWIYLEVLPSGRLAYTILAAVAFALLVLRRRGGDEQQQP